MSFHFKIFQGKYIRSLMQFYFAVVYFLLRDNPGSHANVDSHVVGTSETIPLCAKRQDYKRLTSAQILALIYYLKFGSG